MARKARTVPLKIIRLSLDALDPVESRILRRLDEIGKELRATIEFDMSQDEIDRYALKRLLVDALVYESNGARSAFTAAEVPAAVVPSAAPAAVSAVQPVVHAPAAPAAPAAAPAPAAAVQTTSEPIRQDVAAPAAPVASEATQTPAPAAAGSWQEQLISDSSKATTAVSPLLQSLSWPGEVD